MRESNGPLCSREQNFDCDGKPHPLPIIQSHKTPFSPYTFSNLMTF